MNALPLILTVFVACVVEAVEALTIVLAVGITREWKSTFQGMAVALVVAGGDHRRGRPGHQPTCR